MKAKLTTNWRLVLGVVMALIAIFMFFRVYLAEKEAHEAEVEKLKNNFSFALCDQHNYHNYF